MVPDRWFAKSQMFFLIFIVFFVSNNHSSENQQHFSHDSTSCLHSCIAFDKNKATYELIIPFTCRILERNKELLSHPLLIAEQEESLNWLCTAEICEEKWNSDLMDFDEYQDYIEP